MSVKSSAPVKIGGRSFTTNLSQLVRRPLASMRQMQDNGSEPGEQSFDNQGVWKRIQTDFVLGQGQTYFDQEQESVRRRYRAARAVDTLSDRRQVKTIKKAQLRATLTGVDFNAKIRRTPSNFWIGNSSGISRTASLTDFTLTAVTGGPSSLRSLIHYDNYVYASYSTNFIYRGTVSGSTLSLWASIACSALEVCHGRMIGGQLAEVFEISAAGTKTSIYTHGDTLFRWFAFCPAPNGIYAAGTNGTRCEVHLITVVDATGALAPPIPVAELPAGEYVNRLAFFGGYLFMATSKGVRIGNVVGNGSVVYGPLINVGNVRSIHSDGRFAFFTWENQALDGAYGLGRLSLERFTSPLVPAYSPDISVLGGGLTIVLDVSSDSENPVFVAANASNTVVYSPHTTDYEVGSLYSGAITYGTPERKAAVSIEAKWDPLPAGAKVQVELLDGLSGASYGGVTSSVPGSTTGKAVPSKPLETEEIEVKVTLTPNPSTPTSPVTLRRWTLRSVPMPFKAEEIILPLMLDERVQEDNGQTLSIDALDDWDFLFGLMQARTRVDCEFGEKQFKVYVDGVGVDPGRGNEGWYAWNLQRSWPNGTVLVRLITVEDGI